MIPHLVPNIEGGYPEHDGGEEGAEGAEGLVLTYSISWICIYIILRIIQTYSWNRKNNVLSDSFGQERVAKSGIDKEGDVDSALFLLFCFPPLFQISFPTFLDFFFRILQMFF